MGRVVFMFPGQGSQKVGMGADLVEAYPDLLETYFTAADEILDMSLTKLCFEGPEGDLASTDNTQPAIFTMSMAVLDVLRREGIEPDAVAGHSLGEYSALVCAGVLSFKDALQLVRRRGELMAGVSAKTPGSMAAILQATPEQVREFCAEAARDGGVVEPANFNEPSQTVISGEIAAVERAGKLAAEAGARVVPLKVSAPFHCSLMDTLAEEFATTLERFTFNEPKVPVIANVTGDYVDSVDAIKDALRKQVAGAVRWTDTLQRFAADGYDTFVEVGPGRVLGGLVMKTLPGTAPHSTGDAKALPKAIEALKGTA